MSARAPSEETLLTLKHASNTIEDMAKLAQDALDAHICEHDWGNWQTHESLRTCVKCKLTEDFSEDDCDY